MRLHGFLELDLAFCENTHTREKKRKEKDVYKRCFFKEVRGKFFSFAAASEWPEMIFQVLSMMRSSGKLKGVKCAGKPGSSIMASFIPALVSLICLQCCYFMALT